MLAGCTQPHRHIQYVHIAKWQNLFIHNSSFQLCVDSARERNQTLSLRRSLVGHLSLCTQSYILGGYQKFIAVGQGTDQAQRLCKTEKMILCNNATVDTRYAFVKTHGTLQHGVSHIINKIWLNVSC